MTEQEIAWGAKLIQQNEQITSLTQELEAAKAELAMEKSYGDEMREKFEDGKEQLTIAIEALEFYSKGRHWCLRPMIGETITDKGSTATEALAQIHGKVE